jgi:hypothetical protein
VVDLREVARKEGGILRGSTDDNRSIQDLKEVLGCWLPQINSKRVQHIINL